MEQIFGKKGLGYRGKKSSAFTKLRGLSRHMQRARQGNARRTKSYDKVRFETLEPRILLSADLNPLAHSYDPGTPPPEQSIYQMLPAAQAPVVDMAMADPYLPPFGSLVHTAPVAANFAVEGETDSYSVNVDGGQTLTVAILPKDASIQAQISVTDPGGTSHTEQAAAPGEAIFLHNLPSGTTGGDFTISATSLLGAGDYDAVYWLNANVETEAYGGPANNDTASAVDNNPSSLALPNGASRLAVVGKADGATPDYYAVTLTAGQYATLALSPSAADAAKDSVTLELRGPSDELITMGQDTASNATQSIKGFVAPADGTYYAKVSGQADVEYTLLVTRGAEFDLEPNDQPSIAQSIASTGTVLGSLGQASKGTALTTEGNIAVIGTGYSYADSGLQATVNQINDHTYTNFTATLIRPDQADTLQELQQYDAVVIGGTRYYSNEFATYASALLSYVEAGGGLITTGWAIYDAQGLSGQARTDFDTVVPVNVSGSYDAYDYNGYFAPVGSHPILDGVTSFYTGTYVQYPTGNPQLDAGATLLATTYYGNVEAAAAEIGAGRSVYLGPIYAGYYSGWGTGALRSGNADRLLEQAVAWAAGKDSADQYTIQVAAGSALTIETTTPGDGAGEPVNDLVPLVELFDPAGTLVASNHNGAADGRNALITLPSDQTIDGTYRIKMTPYSGAGDYTLQVTGASGAEVSPLEVTATSVADGTTLASFPDAITLTFSEPVNNTSLDPSDLTVNGSTAASVTLVNANQVRFGIASLVNADRAYDVQLAADQVADLAGVSNTAFAMTFTLDTTGPSVVSSTPDQDGVLTIGANSISVTFDEALDLTRLTLDDVSLFSAFTNTTIAAQNLIYDDTTNTGTAEFPTLAEGSYTLTLFANQNGFTDLVGNQLAGGDYPLSFSVDADSSEYPTPLTAKQPLGSMIYNHMAQGAFHETGDFDEFTLDLDANQTLSVALFPIDSTFQGRITVFGPDDSENYIAKFDTNMGGIAGLNTLPVVNPGAYTIRVTSLDGVGRYEVGVLLNAMAEEEMLGAGSNNDYASTQNINSSFIDLGNGASRGAVFGNLEAPVFSEPPMLLGTIGQGGTPSILVELDPATGAVTRTIGEIGYAVNGLEYNASRDILYGTVSSNDPNAPGYLIEIDMTTGAGTPIGGGAGVGTLVNLTCDSTGRLFAWAQNSNNLVEIDPTTGVGTVIGNAGIGPWTHGLASDANDTLYLVNGNGNVYLINTQNGSSSYLFDIGATGVGNGQAAHHGDFDPATGYYFGISEPWSNTTSLVVVDMAGQTVVTTHDTGVLLHTLTFTAGTIASTPQDWYRFEMNVTEQEHATIALSATNGARPDGLRLDLFDPNGEWMATGTADAINSDLAIRDCKAFINGFYLVRVSGTAHGDYNLLVTKNSAFERESNNSIDQAQDITFTKRVLGAIGNTVDTDDYTVYVYADDQVTITTSTPGDGAYEFVNTLDPRVSVYDPDGNYLTEDDNSGSDGRNVSISRTAGSSGLYRISVASANGGTGEYLLTVNGATADQRPFTVTAAQPENNADLQNYPNTYRVTFSQWVMLTTVSADDLTVNGTPADSVMVIDGHTLLFDISSANLGPDQGYGVHIGPGALQSVSGVGLQEYTAFFTTDQTAPRVHPTSVAEWSVQSTDPLTIEVAFNEAMDPTGLGTEDITLIDGLGNSHAATSLIYDTNTNSVAISFDSLPEGDYTLTLLSNGTAFRDRSGLLLDGDGDLTQGGDFASCAGSPKGA